VLPIEPVIKESCECSGRYLPAQLECVVGNGYDILSGNDAKYGRVGQLVGGQEGEMKSASLGVRRNVDGGERIKRRPRSG
jgi:hypothetical protein